LPVENSTIYLSTASSAAASFHPPHLPAGKNTHQAVSHSSLSQLLHQLSPGQLATFRHQLLALQVSTPPPGHLIDPAATTADRTINTSPPDATAAISRPEALSSVITGNKTRVIFLSVDRDSTGTGYRDDTGVRHPLCSMMLIRSDLNFFGRIRNFYFSTGTGIRSGFDLIFA